MKKILILGAGNIQVPIILKAKELGLYCIVADMDSCAPGFEFSDEQLAISTLDTDKLMKYAENNNLDGVLTTSDYPEMSLHQYLKNYIYQRCLKM